MPRAKISLECPQCHNKDFVPAGPFNVPVINLGGTERTRKSVIRRYFCLQCGCGWKTEEKFYDNLEVKSKNSLQEMYSFMKSQMPRQLRKQLPGFDEFYKNYLSRKVDPNQQMLFEDGKC